MHKLWQLLHEESAWLHIRLVLAQVAMSVLPPYVGSRVRIYLLRLAGFRIGHGTLMYGRPTIVGLGNIRERLTIGRLCRFNVGCYLELGADIVVGDRVSVGQQVMILTNTHEINDRINSQEINVATNRRAGSLIAMPVHIEDGAWISTRCTILPGVRIGQGAVVAAGSLVTKSVAPHTLVGGTPAKLIRHLPTGDGPSEGLLTAAPMTATPISNGVMPDDIDMGVTTIDN